ncbi:geraniol 8-hydroxylase-like [Aristolochia californica]|uniref:geraniol 8-hydroxylase-like n=1 Tax=Aristolochia californica TaxID=171875 RepID=UPI0035DFE3EE
MAWLPPNPHWRKLRMICNTQMFTTQRLDSNQDLRHQKVHELISHLHKHSQTQREVDIGMVTFVTILNLISNTIFTVDLVDIDADSVQEFKDAVRGIMDEAGRVNLADYFPLLRVIDPQQIRRRMTSHFKKLHALFDRLIEERLEYRAASPSSRRDDFLDVLLDYNNDNSFNLSRQDIRNLLVEIFSAGSDTSSSTLEWAMAELLRHPETMAKVRSELLKTLVSGQSIKESDIARLPYLQAVVKETFRLHPPVPLLIPRRAESSVEISGFTIPKHTQLLVNSWAIGRDEENWSEPLRFWPERFLGSNIDFRGRDFEFIPFGAGRRICPGMPLAIRMVHLILASMIQSFDWKLRSGMKPDDIEMDEKFGITLQMVKPLYAVPMHQPELTSAS